MIVLYKNAMISKLLTLAEGERGLEVEPGLQPGDQPSDGGGRRGVQVQGALVQGVQVQGVLGVGEHRISTSLHKLIHLE